jgi:hypothetical protein
VRAIHVYTGPDGLSHMKDLRFKVGPVHRGIGIELLPFLQCALLREVPSGGKGELHPSTRRQLVLHLTGGGTFHLSDGTSYRSQPGDLILYDDVTGKGHRSESEGGGSSTHLLLHLDPDFDLDSILEPDES